MTNPTQDEPTPDPGTDNPPAKQHGDPLLAASEGATEGTEGTRHGVGPGQADQDASG